MFYLLGPQDIDQPYFELGWQPTHAPQGTYHFKRTAFGLFVPTDEQRRKPPQGSTMAVGLDVVLQDMPSEHPGWHVRQLLEAIQQHCRVKERRAKQLVMQLIEEGRVQRLGNGWYLRVFSA
jgi:hypothetical protein